MERNVRDGQFLGRGCVGFNLITPRYEAKRSQKTFLQYRVEAIACVGDGKRFSDPIKKTFTIPYERNAPPYYFCHCV